MYSYNAQALQNQFKLTFTLQRVLQILLLIKFNQNPHVYLLSQTVNFKFSTTQT